MRLQINSQHLEDLCNFFMPYLLMSTQSRINLNKGTGIEMLDKICLSVLKDIDVVFKRKRLTVQKKFSITLKEAEGIIFMKELINLPLSADQFWRDNLRNQIIQQLDKQLV